MRLVCALVEPSEFRRIREALKLTQAQLAAELGVHAMTVSKWERGVQRIPEPVARLVERLRRERKAKRKQ
jgi:DNA-binding transcriptional regulator YiaG